MPAPRKRFINAEDLYHFQYLSDVAISPDGKHVVYRLQRVDKKTEKKYANLWVAPTTSTTLGAGGGGEAKQFTRGDQSDSSPRWSPDGKSIAFLSNRTNNDKPTQVHIIPFDGGEAYKLTQIDGEVSNLQWSSDGRKLLCNVRKLDPDALERLKNEEKKKLGVVARHYDRAFFKLDGYGYLPHERTHIWIVDARTGKAKQLTNNEVWDENFPTFSPDGKWIAFVSNRSKDPDMYPDRDDLFVMSVTGGEAHKLKTPVGPKYFPSFSPDGKWLAYYGHEGEGEWYRNDQLWIVPVEGSKAARDLLEGQDISVGADVIADLCALETVAPVWSNNGKAIYFQAAWHGSSLLKRVEVATGEVTNVIGEGGAVGAFSLDKAQTKVAYFYGQMDDPGQVYLRELGSGTTRHLTHINRSIFETVKLSKVEEVWFKGPEGNTLQGWIMFPPNFDANKKYPSIMEIHGGPQTQYGKFFMHEFYYLAASGYVVYFCNPRGGRGYGEEHTKSIWGAWGTTDYEDLMAWADYIESKPYIDKKRMGVTGGSYGGYMTVWIIGHTDRFEAAVTQRCVSNFVSMWGSSDFNWTFQEPVQADAPFKDLDKFWDRSPIKYIGNAKTPTMVTHSEQDHRCPIEQGEQVFVALKRLGVDTEFVRFPDSPHGLSRVGRTDRRIVRLNHMRRWMDKYLKG
jgi:dipeptidyl aminopeptidase/acylaminoacyl peptidase